jgi:tripartite-type tricarboxylate transporter receptor subunit TctC
VRRGTPDAVSARLLKAAQEALSRPQTKARINAMAIETVDSNPQAFAAFFASQVDTWGRVIKEAGIRAE